MSTPEFSSESKKRIQASNSLPPEPEVKDPILRKLRSNNDNVKSIEMGPKATEPNPKSSDGFANFDFSQKIGENFSQNKNFSNNMSKELVGLCTELEPRLEISAPAHLSDISKAQLNTSDQKKTTCSSTEPAPQFFLPKNLPETVHIAPDPIIEKLRAQLASEKFAVPAFDEEGALGQEEDRADADPIKQLFVNNDSSTSRLFRINKMPSTRDQKEAEAKEQPGQDLRIENELLKQQCETMFSKMLQLQKQLNEAKTQPKGLSEDSLDLSAVDANIVRRKNEFLMQENQMLMKVNREISNKTSKVSVKQLRENELRKELIGQYESYIAQLMRELEAERMRSTTSTSHVEELNQKVRRYDTELHQLKRMYGTIYEDFKNLSTDVRDENVLSKQSQEIPVIQSAGPISDALARQTFAQPAPKPAPAAHRGPPQVVSKENSNTQNVPLVFEAIYNRLDKKKGSLPATSQPSPIARRDPHFQTDERASEESDLSIKDMLFEGTHLEMLEDDPQENAEEEEQVPLKESFSY